MFPVDVQVLFTDHLEHKCDGISGFVSALITITPLSNFAQNNGVIAITRCANRTAGQFCCLFLIAFGILGKISGVFLASESFCCFYICLSFLTFLSVPNPVLGGVTTFLFASVSVSGLRVLSYTRFTRRDRFVLGAALTFGFGDLLVPDIFTHLFDGVNNRSNGLQSLFSSITIVLDTPCTSMFLTLAARVERLALIAIPSVVLISGLVALVLNLILPVESGDSDGDVEEVVDLEAQSHDSNEDHA